MNEGAAKDSVGATGVHVSEKSTRRGSRQQQGEILQDLWAYQIYKPGFLFVIWVRHLSSFKKDVSVLNSTEEKSTL